MSHASILLVFSLITPLIVHAGVFGGNASPDGTRRVYVDTADGDAEIYVSRADGSAKRKLTDNDAVDNYPDWSRDGKQIVFISNRSGASQVHVMDADGGKVRQVTRDAKGADTATFGPDGRIAYAALRSRDGKRRSHDLVLLHGKEAKILQKNAHIFEIAWSPDGRFIACSSIDDLTFHDLKKDSRRVVRFEKVDERMHPHAAFDLRWQDAKSVICKVQFVGGRHVGHKMFGDDEIFVITTKGKVSWTLPEKGSGK